MSGPSSAAPAHAGNNPFLRAVAVISTLAGWCAAAMIVAAVAIAGVAWAPNRGISKVEVRVDVTSGKATVEQDDDNDDDS